MSTHKPTLVSPLAITMALGENVTDVTRVTRDTRDNILLDLSIRNHVSRD